eukprot:GFKZ01012226.1.p1 GENE.GFKZ01012226.1~~GFKZ01012226.1.p1  ORF type:complete len:493 (+),score=99.16 GFKZ01012226.1:549-2027(+)
MPASNTPIHANPDTNYPPSLLHRLFLSLHLSHATFPHFVSLLPSQTPTTIRNILLDLLKPTLPSAPSLTTPQLSAHLLRLLNGTPHSPRPHPPCSLRGRAIVRVTPATATDAFIIRKLNHNPNVEVVLRGARPLWDVIAHLFNKWDVPLSLSTKQGPLRDVAVPIFQMIQKPEKKAAIYLQFSVTYPDADVQKAMCLLRPKEAVAEVKIPNEGDKVRNRKRILAPKGDGGEKRQRVREEHRREDSVDLPQIPDLLFDVGFSLFGGSNVEKQSGKIVDEQLNNNEKVMDCNVGDVMVFDTKDLDGAPVSGSASEGLVLESDGDDLALEGEGGESDGEKAVMERLQVHLQKMKDDIEEGNAAQIESIAITKEKEKVSGTAGDSVVIPEAFLRSGSGFEIGLIEKFPESLFSWSKSEGKENGVEVRQGSDGVAAVGEERAVNNSLPGFDDNARDEFEALSGQSWDGDGEGAKDLVGAADVPALSLSGLLREMREG